MMVNTRPFSSWLRRMEGSFCCAITSHSLHTLLSRLKVPYREAMIWICSYDVMILKIAAFLIGRLRTTSNSNGAHQVMWRDGWPSQEQPIWTASSLQRQPQLVRDQQLDPYCRQKVSLTHSMIIYVPWRLLFMEASTYNLLATLQAFIFISKD